MQRSENGEYQLLTEVKGAASQATLSNAVDFFIPPPAPLTFDDSSLCNLIVNYLPPFMNDVMVAQLFSQFGPVCSTKVIYDKISGVSRGYGFIRYECFFSASFAVANLNRYEIGGKKLKVSYADHVGARACIEKLKKMRKTKRQRKEGESHPEEADGLFRDGFTERQKEVFLLLYYEQTACSRMTR